MSNITQGRGSKSMKWLQEAARLKTKQSGMKKRLSTVSFKKLITQLIPSFHSLNYAILICDLLGFF